MAGHKVGSPMTENPAENSRQRCHWCWNQGPGCGSWGDFGEGVAGGGGDGCEDVTVPGEKGQCERSQWIAAEVDRNLVLAAALSGTVSLEAGSDSFCDAAGELWTEGSGSPLAAVGEL